MYAFLDHFLVVLHTSLVLFILAGWAWRRTRRLHLAAIGLTMFSWFGLGVFYEWGYCPCTDWHWQVKRNLGETDLPFSYIKYYADKLSGVHWDAFVVDTATTLVALSLFALSCWLNWRDWNTRRYPEL